MYYSILAVDYSEGVDIQYEEITYKNQLILTKIVGDTQIIERLYSTNPVDYLNPELQPGTILKNPLINSQKKCYNEY